MNLSGGNHVEEFLKQKKEAAKTEDEAAKYRRLEELYSKKLVDKTLIKENIKRLNLRLWHPLTQTLLSYTADPEFCKNTDLYELYQKCIDDFKHRVSPLALVQLALPCARQLKDKSKAETFLTDVETTVKNNKEAVILCKTGIIEMKLAERNAQNSCPHITDVAKQLVELEKEVDAVEGVSAVHGPFYKAAATYRREIGDHSLYYRDALRYLGCVDFDTVESKLEWAVCLAVAALLAKDVYNFGELLALPIIDVLRGSPKDEWLVQLLQAVNAGDMSRVDALKVHWSAYTDLAASEKTIVEKTRLLCVMEMGFERSANTGELRFDAIAQRTRLPEDQVELLVMRALSHNLVKGHINCVTKTVTISWVQPRVLDKAQISVLATSFSAWAQQIGLLANALEQQAKDVLVKQ